MILNLTLRNCLKTPRKHENGFQIDSFYWLTEKMVKAAEQNRKNDGLACVEHGNRYVGVIVFGGKDDVGSVSVRWKT